MNWGSALMIAVTLVAILIIAAVIVLVFKPLLRRPTTPQQPADAEAITVPTAIASENDSSWGKIWLTLFLTVVIIAGLTLWDWHYNSKALLDAVIAKPLWFVWAMALLIAAVWVSILYLAEPSKWAKYAGAVIVIGSAVSGIIPVVFLLGGDPFTNPFTTAQNGTGGLTVGTDWKQYMPYVFLIGMALMLAGLVTHWLVGKEKK